MQRTTDLLIVGHYSSLTIKSYISELRYLFSYYAHVRPSALTFQQSIDYLIYLAKTHNASKVKLKMTSQSISFFFKNVLQTDYKIPGYLFKAHESKLPLHMAPEEVSSVLQSITNFKHYCVITLIYSTGMRLSEVAKLKLSDIDSTQMLITIKNGKGKKDRKVQLSQNILAQLRVYYQTYKPSIYLFNGQKTEQPYHVRSIQEIFQTALSKAKLAHKGYSIHTLRHSYATHMIENGASLSDVQHVMGHFNMSQTMQYVHMSTARFNNIVNPFDILLSKNTNGHATK